MRIVGLVCVHYLCIHIKTNMRYIVLFILLATLGITYGSDLRSDSLYTVEAVEVTSIKQGKILRNEPLASTTLGSIALANNRVTALKEVQTIVPNLFIPDYGSRITSSIYVRGLGARIDQPVVGLNIDNVPYLNKNGFDTNIMDISKMEMLRGPQSTLYGRNTMGGVINIYTLSPIDFEGTKAAVEYGNGNTYSIRGAHYRRLSDIFAFSASGYYASTDGHYTNDYTGETCDREREGGGRLRMIHYPTTRTTIDNTLSFSLLDQGGYAYRPLETDQISYNDICGYDRTMISNGLTISHRQDNYTISSITGYQFLDDAMRLDQDFTPADIFTLKQAIREHSLTQDVVLRSRGEKKYSYLVGAFGFFRSQQMDAPVTFEKQGMEDLIFANTSVDEGDYWVPATDNFLMNSDIHTNSEGLALYHESTLNLGRWTLKGGVRIDYEHSAIDYRCTTDAAATRYDKDGNVVWEKDLGIDLRGDMDLDFFNVLPKFNVGYKINSCNSLYGSIARGYKAGGYNTQMFSDIIQQALMSKFGLSKMYEAEDIITYRPEYSWNYEVGGHFANNSRTLTADVAMFYIECTDQQVTVFPEDTVTGRMMTNAGESRSYGAELSAMWRSGRWATNFSYGYTNAKFKKYDDNEADYSGNYVPYAPRHTMYGSLCYTLPTGGERIRSVEFEATTNGAGRIYWREDNRLYQPFYALLGGSVRFVGERYTLSLWGKNLLNKRYDTFYFESMGNEYGQWGKPTTYGATLSMTFN